MRAWTRFLFICVCPLSHRSKVQPSDPGKMWQCLFGRPPPQITQTEPAWLWGFLRHKIENWNWERPTMWLFLILLYISSLPRANLYAESIVTEVWVWEVTKIFMYWKYAHSVPSEWVTEKNIVLKRRRLQFSVSILKNFCCQDGQSDEFPTFDPEATFEGNNLREGVQ